MSWEFILLIVSAALCEFVDSGLGMMYGTVLSPVLILLGFSPQDVVPSILFWERKTPTSLVSGM